MTHKKTLECFGDTLRVIWTGSVWEAPASHRTYGDAADAMRDELECYLSASGEDLESSETQELIDEILTNMG